MGHLQEVGRIVVGQTYRFHKQREFKHDGKTWWEDTDGTLYKVLRFARHGVTFQDQVIYEGLDGRNAGRVFVSSLNDFAIHFRLEQEISSQVNTGTMAATLAQVAAIMNVVIPEKVIDQTEKNRCPEVG